MKTNILQGEPPRNGPPVVCELLVRNSVKTYIDKYRYI